MTRNVANGSLTAITGGVANGNIGGGATGNVPNLEKLNNFVQQGTLTKEDLAVFDGVHWVNAPLDFSKVASNYDATKAYNDGALISFNNKVYRATERPDLVPAAPVPNVFTHFSWSPTQTLAEFLAANKPFSQWYNHTGTDVVIPSGPLAGQTVVVNGAISTLGLPDSAKDLFLGGTTWAKGWRQDNVGGSISFTSPEVALIAAELDRLKLILPGQSPTVDPAKWTLVGEPNDPNAVNKKYVDDRDEFIKKVGETQRTILETQITTAYKNYVDDQLAPVISGMEHEASVLDIANAPGANPKDGALYIVGTAPTGAFVGHANAVAFLDNGTWIFSTPQANEAHLNEKDNTIYHWNGTQWNKVGTVAPQALDNLTDVDTTTKAPKTGDLLVFDGTNWVPKTTDPRQPITRGFNPGISANDSFLDLEYDNWQSLDIQALIEIADNPCHIGFRLLNDKHQIVLSRNDCQRASQRLTWGSDRTHDARLIPYKQNTYFGDEYTFGLTWLPGANGGSDRFKPSDYAILRLTMCRTYDNYIIIDGAMFYNSYGNEGYDMQSKFAVAGVGVPQVKSIGFHCHGGPSRIAVNGQYTMTPHA